MSGGQSNDYMDASMNMLNNQATQSNLELGQEQAITPLETQTMQAQLGQSLANATNPTYDWMRNQSNVLTGQMPNYNTNLGLNSPETQQYANLYNNSMNAQMAAQQRNLDNGIAAGNQFGSSYQAGQQTQLGNLLAQNNAQNQISALGNAQTTQQNNLNTWSGLLAQMLGSPTYSIPGKTTLANNDAGLASVLNAQTGANASMVNSLLKT